MGQVSADISFVISCRTLEPANGDWSFLCAYTPASRFAGTISGTPENPGKHVGIPVQHVGFSVLFLRYQADVFRHRCMGRAGILAIDYFMKVVWIKNIGLFHKCYAHQELAPQR